MWHGAFWVDERQTKLINAFKTLSLLYSLTYVRLRLVSPAMESLNAVSYLVFPKTKRMSKVALFMRMKFVNSASSDTRSSDITSA